MFVVDSRESSSRHARAGNALTWIVLEPIDGSGDDRLTEFIVHLDRSIWVDFRKPKQRFQLFSRATGIEVYSVNLAVVLIQITSTRSDGL